MSGPIRKLIGPAKTRLQGYYEEANKILSSAVREETMQDEEIISEDLLERMNTNLNLLERCNRDWGELLKDLSGEKKAAEEKEYDRVAGGSEGFVEIMLNSSETIARLRARLARIVKIRERKIVLNPEAATFQSNTLESFIQSSSHNLSSQGQLSMRVSLPKLQLLTFSGDVQQWPEFWDMFNSSVHEQNLPKVSKFSYLKSVLKDSAAAAISGIPVTTENYDTAITLLKEKFGKKEAIIESLYAKLQNLPKANNKFSEIKHTHEVIEKLLRQLEAQGESISEQRMLIQLLICKYPIDVIVKLEESKEHGAPWSMSTLRKAIMQYIIVQENAYRYVTNERNKFNESPRSSHRSSADVFTNVSSSRRLPCIFCKGDHYNDECDKCIALSDRKKKLSQQGRCFICLKVGHVVKNCPSSQKKPCSHCGRTGYHNRCLCPEKFTLQPANSSNNTGPSNSASNSSSDSSSTADDSNPANVTLALGEKVLLQTATVILQTFDGKVTVKARVLLDSASQRTFMTSHLAQKLNLPSEHKEVLSVSTFGAQKAIDMKTYVVQFKVKLKDGSYMTLFANVLKQITGSIQRSPLVQKDLEFLKVIPDQKMADCLPNTLENATIDLLIGSDYFWDIIEGDKVILPSGMFLLPSKFGYIVTGKFRDNNQCLFNHLHTLFVTTETVGQAVNNLEDLWCLETIGIKDPITMETDEEALRKFNETIKFEEHRYQVAWPWRHEDVCLPENFNLALGRLRSLVYRLKSNRTLLEGYNCIIQQQLQKGIIEAVDKSIVIDTRKYYLPHHPILTPSKTTTKVRIVYDASAKLKIGESSLNECLYRGPVILPDLCGLLLRFRLYSIVILADIEKAFLQLGIQRSDRDVTRFLWLKDITKLEVSDDNIMVYRFCRVPFGLICSPFLLAATIKFHLQKEESPLALHILNNIYVDNVLIGVNLVSETYKVYSEAKIIFEKASMNLREWNSNSMEFLNSITAGERVDGEISKVFGLQWNRARDVFYISDLNNIRSNDIVTKREALHHVAKIFDPLGLFVPVIFYGKVFIQKLWILKQPWDQPLPDSLMESWNYIVQLVAQISSVKIPRFIGASSKTATYQLLVFCDASVKAYAASVYLRIKEETGIKTQLIFSKMRLVPVNRGKNKKELTIPRLELLAVLIGIRAVNFVTKELRLKVSERILWTDSQCVLYWLKTKKPLSVFVENRLKEIKLEKDVTFRYVSTVNNPADFATKGLSVQEIKCSSLWWHGPSWLQDDDSLWPGGSFLDTAPEVLQQADNEVRKSKPSCEVSNIAADEKTWLVFGIDPSQYSSLRKLLRVTVFILRFIKIKVWNRLNSKFIGQHKLLVTVLNSLQGGGPVSAREVKLSCLLWIFAIQHRYFEEVYYALQDKRKNCLQRQLGLKADEFQILRCYGRYANAAITEEMKYPKLLPRRVHFTSLVITEIHQRLIHAGISHTLGQIRQEYWIPQGRAEVRRVLSQCVVCKRHGGPPFGLPNMPPWPRERVSKSEPFQYIGLDYLGPLRVKEGSGVQKMWICLFTCLAVRAVHLELVRGLSAPLFLDCLKRFIARRGKPRLIISDNAPQFRLVKTTLDEQWNKTFQSNEVLNYFSYEGIQWNFTTAFAPWQGGFYERLVGLVKQSLRKGMGHKILYWDKLMTLLLEVEAVINTRPLTYVYEELKSGFVLTPAHFLTGNHKIAIPFCEDDCDDSDYYPKMDSVKELTEYWRRNQKQLKLFWEVWKQEYLLSLRETSPLRHRGTRSQLTRLPQLGEVVIVKDDYLPRGAWKLAQIKEFIFSKDGLVRSVKVELPNKNIISRTINHLFPLEIFSVVKTNSEFSVGDNSIVTDDSRPSCRKAATQAREKISKQLNNEPTCIMFSFPRECHGDS